MMTRILLAAAVAFAFSASAQAKGNAANGKELTKAKACMTCHGEDGNKPSAPDQPVLAGQHYDYLVRALTDYKIGKRNNPIMKGFAAQLSKKDLSLIHI